MQNALYDSEGMLKFIQPDGFGKPLRLKKKEWNNQFRWSDLQFNRATVFYQRFTMRINLEPLEGVEPERWEQVIEIACSDEYVKFGPYKTPGLAKRKALKYLVDAGAVEIVETQWSPRLKRKRSKVKFSVVTKEQKRGSEDG